MAETLLKLDEMEKYFPIKSGLFKRTTGHVKAVDGVSFEIDHGETFALIGESGSGKSTVANTVIGIHQATGGAVEFDGEDITKPSSKQLGRLRERVQMVFQDPTSCLNPRRTIGKSLAVPLAANGMPAEERRRKISERLERVGLNDEYLYKYPHELSGGQKQRINIARALLVEPDLILLDEPTSALDVSVQAKIIELLADLQDQMGLTYLFITHDLSLVRNIADKTGVMYLGQLQEKGPTEEIFYHPRHPYTEALLSAIPVVSDEEEDFKPQKEPLEGEIPSPRDIPSGCRFHPRCPYAEDACTTDVPSHNQVGGTVHGESRGTEHQARCHIYDPEFADRFDESPEAHDSTFETVGDTTTESRNG